MASSIRCKLKGCDPNPCGICSRCGDASQANHAWVDKERVRPCYRLESCERCGEERDNPDHDWTPGDVIGGEPALKCGRCGLVI